MPRRGFIPKRDVLPDPLYGSKIVTRLINNIMLDGKKGVAQKIVYDAFEIVKEKTGRCPAIYNIRYIKPVDEDMLEEICGKFDEIITIEDGCITGGLYGCVAEYTAQRDKGISITPIAIPDSYLSQGTQEELRDECGLTTRRIAETIEGKMKKISKKDRKVLEI